MRRFALLGGLCLAAAVALITAYVGLAGSPIRQLTNSSATDLRPSWSPDGRRVAFQSNRDGPFHIFVMDADGSNVRALTTGDIDDRHPAWSRDGKYVAVDSGDRTRREIWVIEVATRARTQVTRMGAITSFPSWSPDGRRISFYAYRAGAMDLWMVNSDGSGLTQLTRVLATESASQCTFACHAAAWSPDSRRIALSDGDQRRVLLLSALAGGAPAPISPADERSHFPVYLSDGRVVYVTEHVSSDQSYTDLWAVQPDTGAPRSAVAQGVQAQGPFALSADGRELLFASPRSGNFEIYAVTLDDAGKAALAARPERAGPPATPLTPQEAPGGPGLPGDSTLYALAFGVVALLVAIEVTVWVRRRRMRRRPNR